MRAILLALALAHEAAVADEAVPLADVVRLLTEYENRTETDGKVELQLYNKFACWCEDTMQTKTQSIAEAESTIARLSKEILELQASTASSSAEITRLNKAIAENAESITAAESQRSSTNSDFTSQETALETALANLANAIAVLAPHNSTSDGFRDMNRTVLLRVASNLGDTLTLYERTVGPDAVKKTTKARQWVKDMAAVQVGSPHLGTYAPQSTAIQGILQSLEDSLTSDLEELRNSEAGDAQANAELLAAKRQEKAQLEASLSMQESLNTNDGVTLASNELERQETQAQLAADTELLDNTRANCEKRATEWSTRSRIRTEELAGIAEAIETLTGPDAMATFGRQESAQGNRSNPTGFTFTAPAMFLQLSQAMEGPKTRKQLSIISMAAKVKSGHFDQVMHYIDQYVASLDAERADDEQHKMWCNAERTNADNKVAAMTHDLSVLNAEHSRADDKLDELKSELNETEVTKDELNTTLHTAMETRVDEQAAHRASLADTAECIRLVKSAIASLSKVFANNKKLLQVGVTHPNRHALLRKGRDARQAPGLWTGSSGARESDATGVLAVMQGLQSSLEKDAEEQKEAEADAAAQFVKFRKDAEASDRELDEKIGSLERAIAAKDRDIVAIEKEEAATGAEWNATSEYLIKLKPNCDWVELTYQSRKTKRANEVAGLKNAKLILSGFEADAGLVATRASVTKAVPVRRAVPEPEAPPAPEREAASVADELAELNHGDADAGLDAPPGF